MKGRQERFLIVSVGNERFAFPLRDIAEVTETFRTFPIPKAPPEYIGVMNFHGSPVPLLDFDSFLHRIPAKETGTILVLDRRIGSLALRVEGIERIVTDCTVENGNESDWLSGKSVMLGLEKIPLPSLEGLVAQLEEALRGSGLKI